MKLITPILTALLVVTAAVGGFLYASKLLQPDAGGNGGLTAASCTSSTTVMAVGHQQSLALLPARGNRAYARIEQPINATNTVSVATDGAAATLGTEPQLTPATTTSPNRAMIFGRNTDYAYTGAVSAITNAGSSTLIVSECLY